MLRTPVVANDSCRSFISWRVDAYFLSSLRECHFKGRVIHGAKEKETLYNSRPVGGPCLPGSQASAPLPQFSRETFSEFLANARDRPAKQLFLWITSTSVIRPPCYYSQTIFDPTRVSLNY